MKIKKKFNVLKERKKEWKNWKKKKTMKSNEF